MTQIIKQILEKEGIEVLEAAAGEAAIAVLAGRPCELVLMDIQMPGMDGLEATRPIRTSRTVPIIGLSGESEEEQIRQAACCLGVDRKQLETMILPTFLREYEGILQRVREAQETSDYRAVEAWVHRAEGAYFYLGADGLQAQAEALETRIREEKTAPAEEIEGFAEALQTTLDAVRHLL